MDSLVTLVIMLAPAVGAVLILLTPEERKFQIRMTAALCTLISLLLTIYAVITYDKSVGGYQFDFNIVWIPAWGINFHVAMDGISLCMNLLTSFTIFTGVFVSWFIETRTKEFYFLLLTLVTGVFGVFSSLNIFFFYFCYEMA